MRGSKGGMGYVKDERNEGKEERGSKGGMKEFFLPNVYCIYYCFPSFSFLHLPVHYYAAVSDSDRSDL